MSDENATSKIDETAATEKVVDTTENTASDEKEKAKKDSVFKAAHKTAKSTRQAIKERPKMPKFLKLIVIMFSLNFIFTALLLIFTSRDFIDYSEARLIDFLNIVLEMVFLWMTWNRFKVAPKFVICYAAFNIIAGWIWAYIAGNFNLANECVSSLFDFILILYFATSKKSRAYFTEPFGIDRDHAITYDKELVIDRTKWPFWRNLGIYFCVFSLVGHWMEAGLSQLMAIGLIQGSVDYSNTMLWRDWFYPFPMEGLAVVLIALLLYPLWRKLLKVFKYPWIAYLISFLVNMAVCVCIEFSMGLAVNGNHQLWDYTTMPFNFMGQICAQNAFGFGVIASVIAWIVYPGLERLFKRIPRNIMNLVFVVICAAYMIPQTLYLIDPPITTQAAIEAALEDEDLDESSRAELQATLDEINAKQRELDAKKAAANREKEESANANKTSNSGN